MKNFFIKKNKQSNDFAKEKKKKVNFFKFLDDKLAHLSSKEKIYLLLIPFLLFGFIAYYYVYPQTVIKYKATKQKLNKIKEDVLNAQNVVYQYQILIKENLDKNKKLKM